MKLVIIMRTDLNMRKGKMIAQGAHATRQLVNFAFLATADGQTWHDQLYKTVCVGYNGQSNEHMTELRNKARELGLSAEYVRDAGLTELEPGTITCLGVLGEDALVDQITGGMKLL